MAKHTLKIKTGEKTYCGDHYCGGHTDRKLVCSCGWSRSISEYNLSDEVNRAKVEHVLKAEGLMG